MTKVTDINEYKKRHNIPLPDSPFSTFNATEMEVFDALQAAQDVFNRKRAPYAIVVGYEDLETGHISLLKEMKVFTNQTRFENHVNNNRGCNCIGVARK